LKKIIIFLLVIFITIPIHEFSHVLVAREFGINASYIKFGDKIPYFPELYAQKEMYGISIYANPVFLGGSTDVGYNKSKNLPLYQKTLILTAGSISSFLLGIFFLFIAGILYGQKCLKAASESFHCITPILNGLFRGKNTDSSRMVSGLIKNMNENGLRYIEKPEDMKDSVFVLSTMAILSILEAFLNLMPASTSDGFWLLEAMLEKIFSVETAFNLSEKISWIGLLAFVWIIIKIFYKRKM